MNKRPGEYPVSNQVFALGVRGCPPLVSNGPPGEATRQRRRPQRYAWLDPQLYETPPRFERIGNEYQLGAAVVQMIQKELCDSIRRPEPWHSRLGLVRLPGLTDVVARPRSKGESTRKVRLAAAGLPLPAVAFEACIPLEGSDGQTVQWSLDAVLSTTHPVQSVVADYRSGGILCLEDYGCTALWADHYADPDEAASRIILHAHKRLPLTRTATISPFAMQMAVALEDGRLLITNDSLQNLRILTGYHAASLAWGPTASALFVSHNGTDISLLDLRCSNHSGGGGGAGSLAPGQILCKANAPITLLSSVSAGGLLAAAGDDRVALFDMRVLPRPAIEIHRDLLGLRRLTWLDWLGDECLCLMGSDRHGSFLSLAKGLESGRPDVSVLPLGRKVQGLACTPAHDAQPPRLYVLPEEPGRRVWSWTVADLHTHIPTSLLEQDEDDNGRPPSSMTESKRPASHFPLVEYPDRHGLISSIFTATYGPEDAAWPPSQPSPLSSSLNSAALHLARAWPDNNSDDNDIHPP